MPEFFRTAINSKNLPLAERGLRVAAALVALVVAFTYLVEPWMQGTSAAMALIFAVTGAIGFCPACYLVGRKPPHRPAP